MTSAISILNDSNVIIELENIPQEDRIAFVQKLLCHYVRPKIDLYLAYKIHSNSFM